MTDPTPPKVSIDTAGPNGDVTAVSIFHDGVVFAWTGAPADAIAAALNAPAPASHGEPNVEHWLDCVSRNGWPCNCGAPSQAALQSRATLPGTQDARACKCGHAETEHKWCYADCAYEECRHEDCKCAGFSAHTPSGPAALTSEECEFLFVLGSALWKTLPSIRAQSERLIAISSRLTPEGSAAKEKTE